MVDEAAAVQRLERAGRPRPGAGRAPARARPAAAPSTALARRRRSSSQVKKAAGRRRCRDRRRAPGADARSRPARRTPSAAASRAPRRRERPCSTLSATGRPSRRSVAAQSVASAPAPSGRSSRQRPPSDLGRCQLRLHPLKLRAQPPLVKAGSGGMARTSRRSSVMSSMAQRMPSRPKPESFTPPYGMWSMR